MRLESARLPVLICDQTGLTDWVDAPGLETETLYYLNPYTAMLIEERQLPFQEVSHFVADGIMMSGLLSKLLSKPVQSLNIDFSGAAGGLLCHIEASGKKLAIIGASGEEIDIFCNYIAKLYPQLDICYNHSGYFSEDDIPDIIAALDQAAPDVLLISMGSPRQENFGLQIKQLLHRKTKIIVCGAFVSQIAQQGRDYYPHWVVKLKLRWLYRSLTDKRIAKRVLVHYRKFFIAHYVQRKKLRALTIADPS